MKLLSIIFVLAICLVACKKREEYKPDALPKTENVRILQFIDSNMVNKEVVQRQNYFYDQLGRLQKIEQFKFNHITTYHYEYEGGLLSTIQVGYSDLRNLVYLTRNSYGLITQAIVKYGVLKEGNLSPHFSTRKMLFEYTNKGDLLSFCDTTFYQEDTSGYPPIYYFDHVNGRYLRSVRTTTLQNGTGTEQVVFTENRTYNEEGQLLESNFVPKGYASSSIEYSYFPITPLQSAFLQNMNNKKKQNYSPNLDVYELLSDLIPSIDPLLESRIWHDGQDVFTQAHSTLERTDFQGLPTVVFTIDSSAINVPPILKYKRTVRYQVDE